MGTKMSVYGMRSKKKTHNINNLTDSLDLFLKEL